MILMIPLIAVMLAVIIGLWLFGLAVRIAVWGIVATIRTLAFIGRNATDLFDDIVDVSPVLGVAVAVTALIYSLAWLWAVLAHAG